MKTMLLAGGHLPATPAVQRKAAGFKRILEPRNGPANAAAFPGRTFG